MQHNYGDTQREYVNMRDSYVNMRLKSNVACQHDYVECQVKSCQHAR